MKKYSKADQLALAVWAAKCAARVLPIFEAACPTDDRPRAAIVACRTWVRTGVFKMADIRGVSLGAHAAARAVKDNDAACFAARTAGHSVATAHVPQHALGSACYALKAVVAADPAKAKARLARELRWQAQRLPEHLRDEMMKRIVIQERRAGLFITLQKGQDF